MKLAARIALGTAAVLAAGGIGAGAATYVQASQEPATGTTAPAPVETPAPASSAPETPAQTPADVPAWTPTPHVPYAPAPAPETVDPRTAAPDGGPWKDYTQFDPTPAPGPTDGLPCQGSREVCYP